MRGPIADYFTVLNFLWFPRHFSDKQKEKSSQDAPILHVHLGISIAQGKRI